MKKVIIIIALAIAAFVACEKNPVEKTATAALAGQWYVIYNCVDANGDIIPGFEDFNGGYSLALTFNTAANKTDSIWVSDSKDMNLLGYQVKVPCNLEALTFGSEDEGDNIYGPSTYIGDKAIVKNGKIMPGQATTPSGMPADSIFFEVKLVGDAYAAYYGYDHYQVVGYRYTGFAADE